MSIYFGREGGGGEEWWTTLSSHDPGCSRGKRSGTPCGLPACLRRQTAHEGRMTACRTYHQLSCARKRETVIYPPPPRSVAVRFVLWDWWCAVRLAEFTRQSIHNYKEFDVCCEWNLTILRGCWSRAIIFWPVPRLHWGQILFVSIIAKPSPLGYCTVLILSLKSAGYIWSRAFTGCDRKVLSLTRSSI